MKSVYHAGELAVQKQAGVEKMAARVGGGIHNFIPPAAAALLEAQPFAIVGSVEENGRVWASLLVGEPGFLHVLDENTLHVAASPLPGDPFAQTLRSGQNGQNDLWMNQNNSQNGSGAQREVGLLILEPATRRRMRLNGRVEADAEGGWRVHAREVYANCPKYIQERVLTPEAQTEAAAEPPPHAERSSRLTPFQQQWIASADTFFIASAAPGGGADASHRGGNPGFVHVADTNTLLFPDYSGNTMFNTLGNIAANPNAGVLFVDWERGDTLQLTGQARILWEPERAAEWAGAERAVEFQIAQVLYRAGANPLRFAFVQYSRFNPT